MMQTALYVSLSAQVTLEKRLETIANNVSNVNTAGYRADAVKFESMLSRAGSTPVAFATAGENYISRQSGSVTRTHNPLDVAVEGSGWLAFSGPAGPVYTRDGRMQMDVNGQLQTVTGRSILDDGGVPIMLDPDGGPIAISQDGTITQNGNQMATLGVFIIPSEAKLRRFENSGVIPDRPSELLTSVVNSDGRQALGGVRQGYVEGSNVNPVLEMTKLIMTSRAFESASKLIESSEGTLQNAVRTLGEPTKT